MRNLLQNRRGESSVGILAILLILLLLSCFFAEFMRIHTMVDRVETQLTQAANVSIEASMWDSIRIDGDGELDEALALDTFEGYLEDLMGLSSYTLRSAGGEVIYRLEGLHLNISEIPPAMEVSCMLNIPGMYSFLPGMRLPIRVGSRNARTH